MGTLAVQAEKKDLETLLITSDLDMLQLVNHRVKVYALKRGFSNIEEFHPESFEAKYGLRADQFLDLKSLKGDSSDNIPGVPGVGEKTAIQLLKDYETLDGVYKHLPDIKDSLRNKLETGKESAYLSKKVAAIWCDAPLKINLAEMDGTKINVDELRSLLEKLEFRSLLRNLPDGMRSQTPSTDTIGGIELDLPKTVLIDNAKKLGDIKLGKQNPLFIHSRAAGRHGADPLVLVIGSKKLVYVLDLTKLNPKAIGAKLSAVSSCSLVGYDLKSDIKLLKTLGINARNVEHDVFMASFLLNSLIRGQTLGELARAELQYNGASLDDLPTEDFINRAGEFIAVIHELYQSQTKALGKMPKVQQLAKDIEWPLTAVLADMEYQGIELDTKYLNKFAVELGDSISDLEQKIYGHADQEFNISSPSQLADILFVKLNLPTQGVKKGKTGYSTAASELDKLRGLHPIIDLITQYREVTKLKNTYVDTLPEQVDKNTPGAHNF